MILLEPKIKELMLKDKEIQGKSFDPKEWLDEKLENQPSKFNFLFDVFMGEYESKAFNVNLDNHIWLY